MEILVQSPALLVGLGAAALVIFIGIARDLMYRANPERKRGSTMTQYRNTAASLWGLCLVCLVCWSLSGQPLADMGLTSPTGWQAWLVWGLAAASIAYLFYSAITTALDRATRIKLRADFAQAEGFDLIRPRTTAEHIGFQGLSITAGVTEEIIFRGFLISTLALAMPVWVAALIVVGVFLVAHAYQGVSGMLRILPITVFMTAVFLIGGSLWPAILIHVAVDAGAGLLVAIVDAHRDADEAHQDAETASDANALPA